ncbi:MAG: sigma-70 family RNA polymerase sigma factor [Actinomycetota bacterium]|nr:sigma-70 family RNA polymerase sigma factor [Actinomycetota bacterium]
MADLTPTSTSRRRPAPFGDAFPQVLAAAQADAPWAYQRLFEWLGQPVVGYLRGQGADDAEGLANDVFLKAFTNLVTFDGDEDRFRSWVFAIAHNCLTDQRRRQRRRPLVADHPVVDGPTSRSTESEALDRLGSERVRTLLDELSPDQRDVLLLRIVADLTVEQIAQALGKAPGAVKQLQRRGLAALRRRLTGTGGESIDQAAHTLPGSRDVYGNDEQR